MDIFNGINRAHFVKRQLLILVTCLFVCAQSKSSRLYDVHYAGRTAEEFSEVQDILKELELTMMKRRMSEDDAMAKIMDPQSDAFKNIFSGKIGDIFVTSADARMWLDGVKSNRKKRKIYNFREHPTKKWSLPIKYDIDMFSFSNVTERNIIEAALKQWEKETCIRFEKASQFTREQYLYFTRIESEGCNSYVGKASFDELHEPSEFGYRYPSYHAYNTDQYRQPIHLAKDCFGFLGIVMHEIGHALGLYHEAQRLDRDDYIIVLNNNVMTEDLSNFLKPADPTTIETKGIPYDLGSLMHYSALDFSIDEEGFLFTIFPYNFAKVYVLGQRVEIGFYDAKIINLAYCSVSSTALACEKGGYMDPNSRSQCKCPAGWQGVLCTEVQQGAQGCSPLSGMIVHQDTDYDKTFSFYSPNYRNPVNWQYTPGDECYWVIKVPTAYQIAWQLGYDSENTEISEIGFMGMPAERSGCQFWLEIKKPEEVRGVRLCMWMNDTTTTNLTKPQLSHSHELHISFRTFTTAYLAMDQRFLRGFHFQYQLKYYTPSPITTFSPEVQRYRESLGITTEDPAPYDFNYGQDSSDSGSHGHSSVAVAVIVPTVIVFLVLVKCYRIQRTSTVRRRLLIETPSTPQSNRSPSSGAPTSPPYTISTGSNSSTAPPQAMPRPTNSTATNAESGVTQNSDPAPRRTVLVLPTASALSQRLREGDIVVIRSLQRESATANRPAHTAVPDSAAPTQLNRTLLNPNLLSNC